MHWKGILGAGIALFLGNVVVGFAGGGGGPTDQPWQAAGPVLELCAVVVLHALVFAWIAYRHGPRAFVHALLAILVSVVVTDLSVALLSSLVDESPNPVPAWLFALDWALTAVSLAAGLATGTALRRRSTARTAAMPDASP